jgi:glyoxylase-like metal-dependent hydrolase (beta-lactamase superfamily II)
MTANVGASLHTSGKITPLTCHPEGRAGFTGPKDLTRTTGSLVVAFLLIAPMQQPVILLRDLLVRFSRVYASFLSSSASMNSAASLSSALRLFPFVSPDWPDRALPSPQTEKPEWCRALPRPEYKSLERVLPNDAWFEVYKVAPGVFAIYEPHQAEETISYLIVGHKQAVLFDTGMGIGDIRKITSQLTVRPVVVLNSHTHDDHVGGNWEFAFVYGMDTDFTRANAKGSREDAQAEITPDQLCGELPKKFDSRTYATKPWKISHFFHDGFKVNLGGRTLEVISTPGHTPDAISLLDRENGLLFTGDTYYPAPIWLFRPETDLDAYVASVKHLAALAPEVKLVLGAHNVPVASPEILSKLVDAIQAVRAGKVAAEPQAGGKAIYRAEGITFLLRANP